MNTLPASPTDPLPLAIPGVLHRPGMAGAACTTFAIGGPCRAFYDVATIAALQALVASLRQRNMPFRILGAGSNVLIPDQGVEEVIIHLRGDFRFTQDMGNRQRVGAAVSLMTLSRTLGEMGLAGIEFAAGIPGTIGGAVRMNAGAHQGCFADIIEEVEVLLPNGELATLSNQGLQFSYRHSELPCDAIVVSATLRLVESEKAKVMQRRAELLAERKSSQPLTDPCAGSVFKNPTNFPAAARLIEECGLKGTWEGDVCVSPRHANWIVNPGRKGTAVQVRTLVARIQHTVQQERGVSLEPEIIFW